MFIQFVTALELSLAAGHSPMDIAAETQTLCVTQAIVYSYDAGYYNLQTPEACRVVILPSYLSLPSVGWTHIATVGDTQIAVVNHDRMTLGLNPGQPLYWSMADNGTGPGNALPEFDPREPANG